MLKRYHRPKYAVTFSVDGSAFFSIAAGGAGDDASPLAAGVDKTSVRAARPAVVFRSSGSCIRTLL